MALGTQASGHVRPEGEILPAELVPRVRAYGAGGAVPAGTGVAVPAAGAVEPAGAGAAGCVGCCSAGTVAPEPEPEPEPGADVALPPVGAAPPAGAVVPVLLAPGDGASVLPGEAPVVATDVAPGVAPDVAPGVVAVPADPAGVALGSALMTAMICSLYELSRPWISESGWFRRSLP